MDERNFLSYLRPRAALAAIGFFACLLPACGGGGNGGDNSNAAISIGNSCDYATLNTGTQRSTLQGQLSGTDSQGRPLTFSIATDPGQGTVSITNPSTGTFTYTSNTNARGTDSFSFNVSNGTESQTAEFKIVFTPRIMPLGDSITWGVTDDTTGGDTHNPPIGQRVGYRKAIKDGLLADGYRMDFVGTLQAGSDPGFLAGDAEHEGHGAWTALQLVNGKPGAPPDTGSGNLSQWLNSQMPDVVLLHIGTNDLNSGRDPLLVAQDIEGILDAIDNWESGNWPVTVILARIINTNPSVPETTELNNALINNIYPPRAAGGDKLIWVDQQGALGPSDFIDRLHPNEGGYTKMGNTWRYPLSGGGRVSGSHNGGGILPRCG